jgi:signal transduction histidine kinase
LKESKRHELIISAWEILMSQMQGRMAIRRLSSAARHALFATVFMAFAVMAFYVSIRSAADVHRLFIILGGLAGIFLLLGIASSMRQRHAAYRTSHSNPTQAIYRALYARAESTAHFGTYQIILGPDASEETIRWSGEMFRMLGRSPMCGALNTEKYIATYVEPEDHARRHCWILEAFGMDGKNAVEYRIRCEDGTIKHVCEHMEFMSDGNGRRRYYGQVFDITEYKRSEAENRQLRYALQNSIDMTDSFKAEERQRQGQDMHDDLGQLLAAMKIDLYELRRYLPHHDSKAMQRLNGMHDLLASMATSIRHIIADLPPQTLDESGLFNTFRLMAGNLEKRYGIRCIVALPDEEPATTLAVAAAIYRMVQEALTNVIKHAKASCVELRIDLHGEKLHLSIADNGKGLTQDALEKTGTCGLSGMRDRALALDGTMEISRCEGAGTAIRIDIPLGTGSVAGKAAERYLRAQPAGFAK